MSHVCHLLVCQVLGNSYGNATKQLAGQLRSISQRTEYPVCKVIPEHLKLKIMDYTKRLVPLVWTAHWKNRFIVRKWVSLLGFLPC